MSNTEKLYSILAYFGPLFLIGLLLGKDSPKVKFHVNQGLILFLFEVVVNVIISVCVRIPLFGWVFHFLNIPVVVLFIIGLLNAIKEEENQLPFIGNFEIIK